jgi:hypothetical protein
MKPEHAMILCLIGVSLGVAYLWWSSIRVTLLQADLQSIRDELDAAMQAGGTVADRNYLQLRSVIGWIIGGAHLMSIPVILLAWRISPPGTYYLPEETRDVPEEKTGSIYPEGTPPEVERAAIRLVVLLVTFFVLHPPDLLTILILAAHGRAEELLKALSGLRHDRSALERLASLRP